jgi:two-component system chemotaxis response regulator CheB
MIVIGASTGGTRAVETLLAGLPADSPGMVVVLHMPAGFTKSYADRLDSILPLHVVEAEDGALVTPGTVLVAPGGVHLVMQKAAGRNTVHLRSGPPVHHQRPAVDVFFRSVARSVGADAVGVLLTGMGADGAKGMLEMREAGSYTVAEHESTCVVYGMPRVAVELGAAVDVLPLGEIGEAVLKAARSGTDGVARTRMAAARPSPSRPPARGVNREGVAP